VISIVVISKDEEALDDTLSRVSAQSDAYEQPTEIVVVDASDGRLDHIRKHHESRIRWIQFQRPADVRVSIPHQRNAGVAAALGEIIVFTDAGCQPEEGWLERLVAPLFEGELLSFGLVLGTPGSTNLYDRYNFDRAHQSTYVKEFSSGNLAFRREAFDAVGGFDEGFTYGSDVDFSWRVLDVGYRCRSAPDAIIRHDWGTRRRQRRRSYLYGKARMRLYLKHRSRLRHVLRDDPMVVAYPVFILGLPLTFVFPLYPALLLIPAWRNRADGFRNVIVDRVIFGVAALAELIGL
jgi:GT2 family glycosyltransferase